MAWTPISKTVPQYELSSGVPASGYVLKAYSSGTPTNINMAIDSSGATTVGSIALNASGFPEVSGNIVIPYINEKYKLALYPSQAAADADSGAIWIVDDVPIGGDFGSATQSISSTTTLDSSDINNHIEASGSIVITLPDISDVGAGFIVTLRNAGSGVITLTAGASDAINGGSDGGSIYFYPGDFALIQSGTDWSAGLSNSKQVSIISGFHSTPRNNEVPCTAATVGSASSGATYAGARYFGVYEYLWDNVADGQAAVSSGRGASAAADFAANKTITTPDMQDRALIGVSGGGSITTVADVAGATTVASQGTVGTSGATTLTPSQIPSHNHDYARSGSASLTGGNQFPVFDGVSGNANSNSTGNEGGGNSHTHTGGTFTGSATSVVQKSMGVYWYLTF